MARRTSHKDIWIAAAAWIVLTAALPAAARAQTDTTGRIRGRVVSSATGVPVERAAVAVIETSRTVFTDAQGAFDIPGLRPGSVVVRVRGLGFAEAQVPVEVPRGGGIDVVVRVDPVAFDVGTIVTRAVLPERQQFDAGSTAGTLSIGGRALISAPAVGETDVLRVVQMLPGVVARNDYTAGYNVRGGESDQNLVLLDGVPIYNPFHFGGLFSTFMEPAVGEIELLTGGFSARYGGRLSSVLDVRSRDESAPGLHGTASLSLLSSGLMLGGGLPAHGMTWSVAGRRTYADKVIGLLTDVVLPYHFSDVQAHARKTLGGGGSIQLTGYLGQDVLNGSFAELGDSSSADGGDFLFSWGNRALGMALSKPLWGSAVLTQRLSHSSFATDLDLGAGSVAFVNRVSEARATGVVSWGGGTHTPAVGYEFSHHSVRYDVASRQAGVSLFSLGQHPNALSLYAEDLWRLNDRVQLRLGARDERVSGTGWHALSPRVTLTVRPSPDLALTVAGGRYTQWMHALRNEDVPIRLFDFWVASDAFINVASATHLVLGAERWLSANRVVRIETYFKRYDRLLEQNASDDPDVRGDEFIGTRGRSYGLDLFVRQLETGRFGASLAYTYGVSRRVRDGIQYPPAQDRRHTVNAAATYRLSPRSTLAAHLGVATGLPYTDIVGQVVRRTYDASTNGWTLRPGAGPDEPVGGQRNSARYPSFYRLDLSYTRTFRKWGADIAPYVQVVNVSNRKNVFIYTFDYSANPPQRRATSQFPLLPSLGVAVHF